MFSSPSFTYNQLFDILISLIFAGPGSSVGKSVGLRVVRAHVPVTNVRGFEARRALDIYEYEPPGGYGCGWWQAGRS